MSLDELKGVLAIGGVPVVVLLAFFLLLKASRPLEQRPLGAGLTFTILALAFGALAADAAFLFAGAPAASRPDFLLIFAALLAGVGLDAGRSLRGRTRTLAMALGAVLQLAVLAVWTAIMVSLRADIRQIAPFLLYGLFLLPVLLWQVLRPDWTAGWFTRTLSLLMLLACLVGTQWLMAVVWAVLLGGPLLAAFLDRKSKTSNSAPPAMEPTA